MKAASSILASMKRRFTTEVFDLAMDIVARSCLLMIAIALVLPLQGCSLVYSAKPITGRVVDLATKQPIAGANVVAHWVVEYGWEGGSGTDLMLMETVTDADGRYSFPGWGPKLVPLNLPWDRRMKNLSPELIFFKPGYWSESVSNEVRGPQTGPGSMTRTSDWDGKTIALKKFEGSLNQYATITRGVLSAVSYGHCNWKKIPRVLMVLDAEGRRLEKLGNYNSPPPIASLKEASDERQCGSVTEFFEEYQR